MRAEEVHKDYYEVRNKLTDLGYNLGKRSVIEKDIVDDIRSSAWSINDRMEGTIYAMTRIAELCELGKCDRYMVARIKLAACEVCAAEKEMEMLKEMLKIK